MEYLDTYTEDGKFIRKETRNIVHRDALWHNTVHCWLYDKEGNVYFQIRKDEGTFYTTASGHVLAGETIKEAFGREIKEEIGLNIDYEKAEKIDIVKFIMDKEKADGSIWKDRAFANVYMYKFNGNIDKFKFDSNELSSVIKLNAKETYMLFEGKKNKIDGQIIETINNKNIIKKVEVSIADFLVNQGETAITKYGFILEKIINVVGE